MAVSYKHRPLACGKIWPLDLPLRGWSGTSGVKFPLLVNICMSVLTHTLRLSSSASSNTAVSQYKHHHHHHNRLKSPAGKVDAHNLYSFRYRLWKYDKLEVSFISNLSSLFRNIVIPSTRNICLNDVHTLFNCGGKISRNVFDVPEALFKN